MGFFNPNIHFYDINILTHPDMTAESQPSLPAVTFLKIVYTVMDLAKKLAFWEDSDVVPDVDIWVNKSSSKLCSEITKYTGNMC